MDGADPRVILVIAALTLGIWGTGKAVKATVHGVKKADHAVVHTVKHLFRHPIDSAKNGAARK